MAGQSYVSEFSLKILKIDGKSKIFQ